MKIEIMQQRAQIGIKTYNTKMHIRQSRARMRIIRIPAQMHIERKPPEFKIDSSRRLSSIYRGPLINFIKKLNQENRDIMLRSIGRIVDEGNAMAMIENDLDVIADIGINSTTSDLEINLSLLEKGDIIWETGYFKINWTPAQLRVDWELGNFVDIRIDPYKVEILLLKYPELIMKVNNTGDSNAKNVAKDVTKNVAKDVTKNVAKDVTKNVAKKFGNGKIIDNKI